jgi:phosphoribosylformylglycinamidine synthase
LAAIQNVRIGKHITLSIEAESQDEAHAIAESACQKILCNAVMETYDIVIG